ncbi:hypothetical protein Pelo_11296 [Pelomyxa schiedti]|nr:hypothetical protein Pelo_11296 [Pelomyxa schiedti]
MPTMCRSNAAVGCVATCLTAVPPQRSKEITWTGTNFIVGMDIRAGDSLNLSLVSGAPSFACGYACYAHPHVHILIMGMPHYSTRTSTTIVTSGGDWNTRLGKRFTEPSFPTTT